MGVKFIKKHSSINGGSIEVQKENPNKFNDKAYGIVGVNSSLNKPPSLPTVQQQKPTQATISYEGELLKKINFSKKEKDKNVKLKL
jgi:hypothetical protein